MKKITCMTALLLFFFGLRAQTNILPDISLVEFADGFSNPVGIENHGTDWIYIVEQTGKIKIIGDGINSNSPFLNLSDKVLTTGFEQGLLGLAFDLDYATNGYFYVHYTNLDGESRFSRFTVNKNNPKKAMPSSEKIMLEVADPFANHNGGEMAFGPDGYLYFTIGDGGSANDPFNNAQDPGILLGKLLRIDPTADGGYDIPADNPFADDASYMPEIWATGLRNPWRFSFDALTGDLWIPDVGQNTWEEVNYQSAASSGGENYGWSCREGLHFFKADCDSTGTAFTDPVAEYMHDDAFPCSGSITGGYVYRGDDYPDMYGKYIYTDFCTGVFRTVYWDGSDWVSAELGNFTPFAYSTFGQDSDLNLYVANKTSGTIYLVTDGANAPMVSTVAAIPEVYFNPNQGTFGHPDDIDVDEMIIESIRQTPLAVMSTTYPVNQFALSPNPNHGNFQLEVNAVQPETYTVSIRDIMGREILDDKKELIKGLNQWEFHSPLLTDGVYFIQIRNSEGMSTMKFVVE